MPKSHHLLITVLFAVFFASSYSPAIQKFEGSMYDLYSQLLPGHDRPSSVAVIALDQRAMEETGDWPWSQSDMGKLITRLQAARPKAIGLMLPLGQSQMLADKQLLERELKNFRAKSRKTVNTIFERLGKSRYFTSVLSKRNGVILSIPYRQTGQRAAAFAEADLHGAVNPMEVTVTDHVYAGPFLKPLFALPDVNYSAGQAPPDIFSNAAAGVGFVQAGQAGETIYRDALILNLNGQYYPSLPLQLVASTLGVKMKSVSATPGESVVVSDHIIRLDTGNNIYPASANSKFDGVPVYSAVDIINGAIEKKRLTGKTLVVGFTTPALAQEFSGPGDSLHTPVTWVAHTTNSLLNDKLVHVPGWSLGLQRAALLVAFLYLLLLPARFRGRVGLIVSIVLALLLINASFIFLLTKSMWLMLALPAVFLLVGHAIVAMQFQRANKMQMIRDEMYQAWIKLGNFQQSQGKLDDAFASYEKCPVNDALTGSLYKLALDYERRRQFSQASSVYETIAKHDPSYKDIKDRRERHNTLPNKQAVFTGTNPGMSATIVIDDPNVERPVLGRYMLESELGRGAMGMVYLGKDPTIGRTVAVKTLALSEEFETEYIEEVRRRFFIEAETAGRLNHPNIVTIFDAGEEHDLAYIAMDYIEGEPLNNFSRPGNLLPLETIFSIGIRAAEALDYAHRQKVVHRDVKPGNMIYDPETDTLKITDFGIACLTDNSRTRSGTVLGSPSYMSPEQLSGVKVDGRSDLFSLGVTLYQLFTGELPYQAESMAALAYKIMNDKHKSIRKIRPELPGCLTRIINKAMEKDVGQRYPDGNSLAEALKRCAG